MWRRLGVMMAIVVLGAGATTVAHGDDTTTTSTTTTTTATATTAATATTTTTTTVYGGATPPFVAAVHQGLRELDQGGPGEGVVASWVLLERAAADAGTHRAAPDTPSELAGRLIDRHPVSSTPLLRLAELYREARFSRHELPESARTEARAALVDGFGAVIWRVICGSWTATGRCSGACCP